jgi:PhnB protein
MLPCEAAAFGRPRPAIAFPPRSGTAFDSGNPEEAKMAVKAIPEGYRSLTPYLIVADGNAAIAFYQNVFGAKLRMRLEGPGGKLGHAELEIGNSLVMLADEHREMGALAPPTIGGTPVGLHLYLDDVDAVAAKAVAAGATLKRPVESQFYGDRLGSIVDPFGHLWHISTHIEDVSPEEIGRRAAAMAQGPQP